MTRLKLQKTLSMQTLGYRLGKLARRVVRKASIDIVRYPQEARGVAEIAHLLEFNGIDVVFDIGANVGQYAQQIRRNGYRGRIVSFEPVTSTHTRLLKVAETDAAWSVAPRMAIGETDGETEIQVSTYSDMSSLLSTTRAAQESFPRAESMGTEAVRKRKLDNLLPDYVRSKEKIFVKLDTQGFERRILDGATNVLPNICGLQLELSLIALYDGECLFDELHKFVCSLGFEPRLFIPGFYSRRIGHQLQVDCVYFRKAEPINGK